MQNNKNVGVTVELDFSDSSNVQIVSAAAASGLKARNLLEGEGEGERGMRGYSLLGFLCVHVGCGNALLWDLCVPSPTPTP